MLGLDAGASVAVLRVGEGLMLIPEQNRFRILGESIASVFEWRQLTSAVLLDMLPEVRQPVLARFAENPCLSLFIGGPFCFAA